MVDSEGSLGRTNVVALVALAIGGLSDEIKK